MGKEAVLSAMDRSAKVMSHLENVKNVRVWKLPESHANNSRRHQDNVPDSLDTTRQSLD
jgi:hypothetical protein